MIDPIQFDRCIVQPTLDRLGMSGIAARVLLLGTALTESGLVYLTQLGNGPARGVFQMEVRTHDDIWANYLPQPKYRDSLAPMLAFIAGIGKPGAELMCGNLYYATAMCRVHYKRVPKSLPNPADATALAIYHKTFYNTSAGATDISDSVRHFQKAIDILNPQK